MECPGCFFASVLLIILGIFSRTWSKIASNHLNASISYGRKQSWNTSQNVFLLFIFVLSGIQINIWVIKTLPESNILPCYRILQRTKTFADYVLFHFNYPRDVSSLCTILKSTYHYMALVSIQICMSAIIFLFTINSLSNQFTYLLL